MKCLSCIAFHFPPSYLSTTASFSLIMRLRKCSLRIWHWQMSNYSSYIHESRLWPARPAISPIDAECEHPSLSTLPPRKVAWSVLACHPSPFPLDCRSCVTVPLTDHWPRWGHVGGWSNVSLGSVTSTREDRKTLCDPYSSDIFIDTERFKQGSGGILAVCLHCLEEAGTDRG